MKKTIDISFVIGDDIRTRSRIHQLDEHIEPGHKYELNFASVNFISRSFADELVSLVDSSNGLITCINMPEPIRQLTNIVRKNRQSPHNTTIKNDVVKLETYEQMEAFFEAI